MAYPWNKQAGVPDKSPPSLPSDQPSTPYSPAYSPLAQTSYPSPAPISPVQSPGGQRPQSMVGRQDSGSFRQPSSAGLVSAEDTKRKRMLDEETKARVQVDLDKETASQKAVRVTETEALQASQAFNSDCTKAVNQLNDAKKALDARLKEVGAAYTRTEGELKTLAGMKDFVAAGELGEVKNELEETASTAQNGIKRAGEGLTEPVEASLNEMMRKFDEDLGRMEGTAQDLIGRIQAKRYNS